jgi:hypothetical protein
VKLALRLTEQGDKHPGSLLVNVPMQPFEKLEILPISKIVLLVRFVVVPWFQDFALHPTVKRVQPLFANSFVKLSPTKMRADLLPK